MMQQLESQLRDDVQRLAGEIGERNVFRYAQLTLSAAYIEESLRASGYQPARQMFEARGRQVANIEAEIRGRSSPEQIVILGAHYDTARGTPGANDNASGVAALLALARQFAGASLRRTLRFVAFTNEEPPFVRTSLMGSRVYARRCRQRNENIAGMISLETIAFCSQQKGSQLLSLGGLLLPSRANFIALVANRRSRQVAEEVDAGFQRGSKIPSKLLILPTNFPGAWSSDHWCFWREGFPALMITDTAPLRYRYYHRAGDTPDKLQYDFFAEVVKGVSRATALLADEWNSISFAKNQWGTFL